MTNAAVAGVAAAPTGRTLKLAYKGGESEIMVGADAPIVTFEPADAEPFETRRDGFPHRAEAARRHPDRRPRHGRKGRRQAADVTRSA